MLVGSIAGVEIRMVGKDADISGKNKKKKEKKIKGVEVDVRRRKEIRVTGYISPTCIWMDKETWAMVVWSEESVDKEGNFELETHYCNRRAS